MGWERREKQKGPQDYSCRSSCLFTSLQIRPCNSSRTPQVPVLSHLLWNKINTVTEPNFYQLLLSIIFMNACFIADKENTLNISVVQQSHKLLYEIFSDLPPTACTLPYWQGAPSPQENLPKPEVTANACIFSQSPAITNSKLPC